MARHSQNLESKSPGRGALGTSFARALARVASGAAPKTRACEDGMPGSVKGEPAGRPSPGEAVAKVTITMRLISFVAVFLCASRFMFVA